MEKNKLKEKAHKISEKLSSSHHLINSNCTNYYFLCSFDVNRIIEIWFLVMVHRKMRIDFKFFIVYLNESITW